MRDDACVSADFADLSTAYWRHHQLSQGDRHERLAAQEYFWVWDVVGTATWELPAESLQMIDAILHHPDADPVLVGAGPIEDLLSEPAQWKKSQSAAEQMRSGARRWVTRLSTIRFRESLSPYTMRARIELPVGRKRTQATARKQSRNPRPARKPRGLRGK